MSKLCHKPGCDHKDCGCCVAGSNCFLDNPTLIPACILITAGICQASFCCLVSGIAIFTIGQEINRIRVMLQNCGPWY